MESLYRTMTEIACYGLPLVALLWGLEYFVMGLLGIFAVSGWTRLEIVSFLGIGVAIAGLALLALAEFVPWTDLALLVGLIAAMNLIRKAISWYFVRQVNTGGERWMLPIRGAFVILMTLVILWNT